MPDDRSELPERPLKAGHWVQTERAAHELWAALLRKSPKAAEMLHLLVARVGEHNAVIISQGTLAELMGCSVRTIRRATKDLVAGNWIELRRLGTTSNVNAYVVNDRVAWARHRDGLRYSLFSASVVLSASEQPDEADLGTQEPLQALPSLFPGERQLPGGPGLPPPSEPDFPGLEPDLPARTPGRKTDV